MIRWTRLAPASRESEAALNGMPSFVAVRRPWSVVHGPSSVVRRPRSIVREPA